MVVEILLKLKITRMYAEFHTGNWKTASSKIPSAIFINSNQTEEEIIKEVFNGLTYLTIYGSLEVKIFCHSEVAFTAFRVWCKQNPSVEAEVRNWDANGCSIHPVDKDGRIDNWSGLFEGAERLLNKLL